MKEKFTEIWNNAYDIYCDTDEVIVWDYLKEQINNGNITFDDAQEMLNDIIETYNL